jgi:DNA-binding CsgD family transcriptional regulator
MDFSLNDEQKMLSHISQTFYAFFEGTTPQYMICKSFVIKLAPDGSIAQRLHHWSESLILSHDIKNTILYLHASGLAAQFYTYENNDPETEKTITRAEQSVWHALVKHDTVDKVAEALFVSRNTIESHRKKLFKKLGISSIKALIKLYVVLGIQL